MPCQYMRGQPVLLQQVHAPALLRLVERERLLRVLVVVELGQHQLAVAGHQRAGGVAVVPGRERLAPHGRDQVPDHHGGLLADRRPGLRGGQVAGVAQAEDVRIAGVLQRVLVHVHPAGGVGQRAPLDEVRGAHRRRDVDHVVGDATSSPVSVRRKTASLASGRRATRSCPNSVSIPLRAITLLQRPGVPRHREDRPQRRGEDDPRLVPHARAAEVVVGQVHDLLGRPAALDRRARVGEQRRAAPEVAEALPGVVHGAVVVVAADAVGAEVLLQALDLAPVDLDARRDDQEVVADRPAASGRDEVLVRAELGHGVPDPGRPLRDEVGLLPLAGPPGEDAGPDQRPERLVVVLVRGLDDGDVGPLQPAGEAGGDGDPRRAAADDDDPGGRMLGH